MKLKSSSAVTPRRELIDAVMDLYVIWREQCVAVETAYRAWSRAPARERGRAFEDYAAALDREELAADEYWRLLEEVQSL